jgi:hypothetical protein
MESRTRIICSSNKHWCEFDLLIVRPKAGVLDCMYTVLVRELKYDCRSAISPSSMSVLIQTVSYELSRQNHPNPAEAVSNSMAGLGFSETNKMSYTIIIQYYVAHMLFCWIEADNRKSYYCCSECKHLSIEK